MNFAWRTQILSPGVCLGMLLGKAYFSLGPSCAITANIFSFIILKANKSF